MARISARRSKAPARDRILDAGVKLVRARGFAATSVDDLCREAGVTKGAFFHYFESKEALGVALAAHWTQMTTPLFVLADYHRPDDPAARVLAYIDFRAALVEGPVESFTCLAGTLVQEVHASSASIRNACADSIFGHARTLEADIAKALRSRGLPAEDAPGLAAFMQCAIQGGFILAKAKGEASPAREAIAHLKRYFELLFGCAAEQSDASTIQRGI